MQRPSRVPGHLYNAHFALLQKWLQRRSRLEVASDSVFTGTEKTRLVMQTYTLHSPPYADGTSRRLPVRKQRRQEPLTHTPLYPPRCAYFSCFLELCLGLAASTKKRASDE